MIKKATIVTLLVRDQDEALRFYTETLGLEKRMDDTSVPGLRWLTVAPPEQKELQIVLAKAKSEEDLRQVGKQAGTFPLFVLNTDGCRKDYETLKSRGVRFLTSPKEQPWGTEAIFEDLYGNRFDLLERPMA